MAKEKRTISCGYHSLLPIHLQDMLKYAASNNLSDDKQRMIAIEAAIKTVKYAVPEAFRL